MIENKKFIEYLEVPEDDWDEGEDEFRDGKWQTLRERLEAHLAEDGYTPSKRQKVRSAESLDLGRCVMRLKLVAWGWREKTA